MKEDLKNEMAKESDSVEEKKRCRHGIVKLWCGLCQDYQPTVTKKETITAKKEKVERWVLSKKYQGILNGHYKLCGVKQCASNSNDSRCPQPVYSENETLCCYHQKIEDRKIG